MRRDLAPVRGTQPGGVVGQQGRLRGVVVAAEEADVVEAVVLFGIAGGGTVEGLGVGGGQHGQRLEPLGVGAGQRPGDHAAPVVRDEVEAVRALGVGEGEGVGDEFGHGVVGDLRGAGARGVAALVDGDGAVAGRAQGGQHRAPGVGELGPAVQQQDEVTVGRSGRQGVVGVRADPELQALEGGRCRFRVHGGALLVLRSALMA